MCLRGFLHVINGSSPKCTVMKLFVSFAFIMSFFFVRSQSSYNEKIENNKYVYFAQGLFSIPESEISSIEEHLRNLPFLKVVRLDQYSKRFFILTENVESVTEDDLRSWFLNYGDKLKIVQIGLHGYDIVESFPFANAEH